MSNLISGNGRGSLLSWDPMRLFDELMSWEPVGSQVIWSAYESPLKVTSHDDGATITIDMPGVSPEDVELTFQEGVLAIAGKRGDRVYRHRVQLGDAYDPDRFEADLDKGVLTVQAYKRPEAKPRRISLKGLTRQKSLDSGDK